MKPSSKKAFVAAAVAVVLVLASCMTTAEAVTPVTYSYTQFYLYAVAANNWVRVHTAYPYYPMRAADGIPKSSATKFWLNANAVFIGQSVQSPSQWSFLVNSVNSQGCDVTNGLGVKADGTVSCNQAASTYFIVEKAGGSSGTTINLGDSVYIKDASTSKYCLAPPWPTNSAMVMCNADSPGSWGVFHIEA